MNIQRWLRKHSLKLLAIRDTPEAIAGGVAIGIFFGFMPVVGLKTVSAIVLAWLTGSNILAAVLAGAMHDLLFPLMPAIYVWEYRIGYWLLSHPHAWPPHWRPPHLDWLEWHTWSNFLFGDVGRRLLVGGAVCAAPFSLLSFGLAHIYVTRHQRKRRERMAEAREDEG